MNKIPVDCQEQCPRPRIFPENNETIEVFNLCKNQLIVSAGGDILGLDIVAVIAVMNFLGIENQEVTLEKVLLFSETLYKRN